MVVLGTTDVAVRLISKGDVRCAITATPRLLPLGSCNRASSDTCAPTGTDSNVVGIVLCKLHFRGYSEGLGSNHSVHRRVALAVLQIGTVNRAVTQASSAWSQGARGIVYVAIPQSHWVLFRNSHRTSKLGGITRSRRSRERRGACWKAVQPGLWKVRAGGRHLGATCLHGNRRRLRGRRSWHHVDRKRASASTTG